VRSYGHEAGGRRERPGSEEQEQESEEGRGKARMDGGEGENAEVAEA